MPKCSAEVPCANSHDGMAAQGHDLAAQGIVFGRSSAATVSCSDASCPCPFPATIFSDVHKNNATNRQAPETKRTADEEGKRSDL